VDFNRGFQHVTDWEWNKFVGERPALPRRMTENAACYDIFLPYHITLDPGEEINIPTGFKVYMKPNECFKVYSRSGLGFKFYARLANGTGVIDADYFENERNDGHVFVKIRNEGALQMYVVKGQGIAQGMFQEVLYADGDVPGEKRVGGFGSTTKA